MFVFLLDTQHMKLKVSKSIISSAVFKGVQLGLTNYGSI